MQNADCDGESVKSFYTGNEWSVCVKIVGRKTGLFWWVKFIMDGYQVTGTPLRLSRGLSRHKHQKNSFQASHSSGIYSTIPLTALPPHEFRSCRFQPRCLQSSGVPNRNSIILRGGWSLYDNIVCFMPPAGLKPGQSACITDPKA